MFGIQLLVIAREKDGAQRRQDFEEVWRIGARFMEAVPGYRGWWAGLALAELEVGAIDKARAGLQRLAAEGFENLPKDALRLPILVVIGWLACSLDEKEQARALYRCMRGDDGTHVMLSLVAAYAGPISHHLGMLASISGDPEAAQAHFLDAIRESHEVGSPNWQAWAEYECGVLLGGKRPAEAKRGADLVRSALATARRLGLARLEKKAKAALRKAR